MIPEHQDPPDIDNPKDRAFAPYNFIPLANTIIWADDLPDHDRYDEARKTGMIICQFTTQTPVYTRTMVDPDHFRALDSNHKLHHQDEDKRRKYAQIYHHADPEIPYIPGSSLRGMIRSLVEILSFSRLNPVPGQRLIYRAVADSTNLGQEYRRKISSVSARVFGGYLKKDRAGWYIQPAQNINGQTYIEMNGKDIKSKNLVTENIPGSDVSTWLNSNTHQAFTYNHDGHNCFLISSGSLGRIKREYFYLINPVSEDAEPVRISNELWKIYSEDVKDGKTNPKKPKRRILEENSPLFYLLNDQDQLVFFGPCRHFRIPYEKSPKDLLPPEHTDSRIDIAEAIFGRVLLKKEEIDQSIAGRVSFSDARCISNQNGFWLKGTNGEVDGMVVPRILSNPKPTSFQLYLTQQEPDDLKALDHYGDLTTHETTLRGHKRYWHLDKVKKEDYEESDLGFDEEKDPLNSSRNWKKFWEGDTQHTMIRPVAPGVTFEFTIRFENLSEVELGALLWALRLPVEEKCFHQLGMGKPFGMGRIEMKDARLIIQNRKARYQTLDNEGYWYEGDPKDDSKETGKEFIDTFETDIKNKLGQKAPYSDLSRIQLLISMLRLPPPQYARYYMPLEFRRNVDPFIRDQDLINFVEKYGLMIKPHKPYQVRCILPDPAFICEIREIPKSARLPRRIVAGMVVNKESFIRSDANFHYITLRGYPSQQYQGRLLISYPTPTDGSKQFEVVAIDNEPEADNSWRWVDLIPVRN